MSGDGEVGELIIVQIALVNGQHGVVEAVVGILRAVGPYGLVQILVAIAVEHQVSVGVGHLGSAVHDVEIGISGGIVQARYGNPEIAITVIVLVRHHVLIAHLIVVPRRHEDNGLLIRRSQAEGHGAVSVLHGAHFGGAAWVVGLLRGFRHGHFELLGDGLAGSRLSGSGESVSTEGGELVGVLEFVGRCLVSQLSAVHIEGEVGIFATSHGEGDRLAHRGDAFVVG